MAIILQEALRGLFYAPFYVALVHDAFAKEGVEIKFVSSPHPEHASWRRLTRPGVGSNVISTTAPSSASCR